MASANTEFSVANLEFSSIKSNLISFMEGQDVFKDYNFTGSSLNVLMDLLSYNTYYNNIYLNHVATEMFLDSAQLRDSVYSVAKALNYLPRSHRSSVAYVNINVNPDTNLHQVVIPRMTTMTSVIGDNTYTFSTNSDITVYANNSYTVANVAVYEGDVVQEAFLVSNPSANSQYFNINNSDIDVSSLTVKIRTSNTDSTNSSYTRSNTLFGLTGTSNVYFVEASTNGSYNVVFGNGNFGRQPVLNNLVEIIYRRSSGIDPNGANSFSADSIAGHDATISTVLRASDGAPPQNLDDIRFSAPRALSTQERAVTREDYKNLVLAEFNDVTSINVYDGADEPVPQMGIVKVAVHSDSYDVLPTALKSSIINFLKPKQPIGIRADIVDPEFTNIVIDAGVKFDKNDTLKTSGQIHTLVSDAIVTYNNDNLDDFHKTLRKSKVSEAIDDADTSIVGSSISVRMLKSISPTGKIKFTKTLEFNQPIARDNPVDEATQDKYVSYSTPAVTSETFVFDNITGASIRDNGDGGLQVVTVSDASLAVLANDVGTVNYETGTIKFIDLLITSFTSGAVSGSIKLYVRPKDQDVTAKRNDIVRIRPSDTTVTVTELRL